MIKKIEAIVEIDGEEKKFDAVVIGDMIKILDDHVVSKK